MAISLGFVSFPGSVFVPNGRLCGARSCNTSRLCGSPCRWHAVMAPASEALADRSQFPILHQSVHGRRLVYLDSAATSQKPESVVNAMIAYYRSDNSNVHRGAHTLAARATEDFEKTRIAVKDLIGADNEHEIVYTRNATEAINLVALTWGRKYVTKGDEIVISVMEHHANLVPWQMLAEAVGANIVAIPLTESQTYDVDALQNALSTGKVKLVAFSHVSNVLGCINPVNEIIKLAKHAGAVTLVDACQSVPHMRVNVREMGCDFLVASGHKMCGPTGVGFLYGRKHILEDMPPFLGGGEMISDVFIDHSTYADLPFKFEAGTPAIGEAVGLGAAIDYLKSLSYERIEAYEHELATYLYDSLTQFEEVTVYGPPPPRAALCAFNIKGLNGSDIATVLDLEGVAVRSGHHCAQPLHRSLGVESSARASLYVYNTKSEVDDFITALKSAVDLLGGTLTPTHKSR